MKSKLLILFVFFCLILLLFPLFVSGEEGSFTNLGFYTDPTTVLYSKENLWYSYPSSIDSNLQNGDITLNVPTSNDNKNEKKADDKIESNLKNSNSGDNTQNQNEEKNSQQTLNLELDLDATPTTPLNLNPEDTYALPSGKKIKEYLDKHSDAGFCGEGGTHCYIDKTKLNDFLSELNTQAKADIINAISTTPQAKADIINAISTTPQAKASIIKELSGDYVTTEEFLSNFNSAILYELRTESKFKEIILTMDITSQWDAINSLRANSGSFSKWGFEKWYAANDKTFRDFLGTNVVTSFFTKDTWVANRCSNSFDVEPGNIAYGVGGTGAYIRARKLTIKDINNETGEQTESTWYKLVLSVDSKSISNDFMNGCVSFRLIGKPKDNNYETIKLSYYDENETKHTKTNFIVQPKQTLSLMGSKSLLIKSNEDYDEICLQFSETCLSRCEGDGGCALNPVFYQSVGPSKLICDNSLNSTTDMYEDESCNNLKHELDSLSVGWDYIGDFFAAGWWITPHIDCNSLLKDEATFSSSEEITNNQGYYTQE